MELNSKVFLSIAMFHFPQPALQSGVKDKKALELIRHLTFSYFPSYIAHIDCTYTFTYSKLTTTVHTMTPGLGTGA